MYPIDFFYKAVRTCPDSPAVEEGEAVLSYAELHREVQALAAALQELDPAPLSRVGICASNHLEHLIAWLAILAAGKCWVPLFKGNAPEELVRAIDFVEASLVIADDSMVETVAQGRARIVPVGERAGGTADLRRRHAGSGPQRHFPSLAETQAIKFTGGTTGTPKGVMQSFRTWNTNIVTTMNAYSLRAGERYLTAAPITHGTSTYILPTLYVGGTVILTDRPRPRQVLEFLETGGITTLFVPPTVIYMMLEELGDRPANTPALRNLVYGAAPMQPDAIERAQAAFGAVLASTYGQTEAPQIATYIGPEDLARPEKRASVGRATLLTSVEVMDERGGILPPGEEGEVVIRGDLVMTGYWRQPEKTAETIRDGWLHTGDIGCFDEEGFLFLKGRLKDVVITGGFNVYPADVEPVLVEHPDVSDAAIYGMPDAKWGEAVHAAVQLREGASVTEEELIAFAKQRLGSVKAPKRVVFRTHLPRSAYGKLQKQVLIEQALEEERDK